MRRISRQITAAMVVAACSDEGGSASGSASSTTSTQASTSPGSSSSTGGAGGGGASSGVGGCIGCGDVIVSGIVATGSINEASGIVASKIHSGVYYVHNDSGDSPRFFAVGGDGADLGTFNVSGASAVDWEDIGRGPCEDPAKSCLFFADIGDNPETRQGYVVYRVVEPVTLGPGVMTATADAIRFTYPDGSHNAEALFVDPGTGAIVIVTKNANESRIYRLSPPFDTTGTAAATFVGKASVPDLLPLVTGADMRSDRSAILLRTYSSVWYFQVAPGESPEIALGRSPCSLTAPREMQGEAIAWTGDGTGYLTLSEGAAPELHAVSCR